ncbi:MAG: hypothetical protein E6F93_14025, partial [Actinobacteria bacterium]
MILILILGLLLVGGAVALILQGWRFSQTRTAASIEQIGAYGFSAERQVETAPDQRTGAVAKIADRVGSLAPSVAAGGQRAIRKELIAAGLYDTSPRMIVGYRILLAGGLPLVWVWLAVITGF